MIRPNLVRHRVVVSGRVQGVYFRASCASEAERLELAGWVGNQPDGSVYAEFEGLPAAVEAMVAWCHSGPPRAAVTSVDVTELEPTGGTGFAIH